MDRLGIHWFVLSLALSHALLCDISLTPPPKVNEEFLFFLDDVEATDDKQMVLNWCPGQVRIETSGRSERSERSGGDPIYIYI